MRNVITRNLDMVTMPQSMIGKRFKHINSGKIVEVLGIEISKIWKQDGKIYSHRVHYFDEGNHSQHREFLKFFAHNFAYLKPELKLVEHEDTIDLFGEDIAVPSLNSYLKEVEPELIKRWQDDVNEMLDAGVGKIGLGNWLVVVDKRHELYEQYNHYCLSLVYEYLKRKDVAHHGYLQPQP